MIIKHTFFTGLQLFSCIVDTMFGTKTNGMPQRGKRIFAVSLVPTSLASANSAFAQYSLLVKR